MADHQVRLVENEPHFPRACGVRKDQPIRRRKSKRRFHVLAICVSTAALVVLCVVYFCVTRRRTGSIGQRQSEISVASYPSCGRVAHLCNDRDSCRTRRLVGGRSAIDRHSWPWMVEILVDGVHYCGGTLIGPVWVLTAAHCLHRHGSILEASSVAVRTGHLNRIDPETSAQTVNISRVVLNSAFDRRTFKGDIGLLKLNRSLRLDELTWPACLPNSDVTLKGTAVMTGWGRRRKDLPHSNTLQMAVLPLVPTRKCARHNRGIFQTLDVDLTRQICAGGGKTSPAYGCDGDSGGPLSWQDAKGRWIVAGITSWGDPECSSAEDTYTVFTRVASYEDWIRDYLKPVT